MKKHFLRKLVFLSLLLGIHVSFSAQNSSIKQYLDDGGIAASRSLIKIDPLKIYEGNLLIAYEHRLDKHWAIESGIGFLMGFYNPNIPSDWIARTDKEDYTLKPNKGFSLMLAPKFYNNEWSNSFYCALPVNYRLYPGKIHLFDTALTFGKQWIFDNGLLVDISLGIGCILQSSIDDKSYIFDATGRDDNSNLAEAFPPGTDLDIDESFPSKIAIHMPVSIKIGYRFKSP